MRILCSRWVAGDIKRSCRCAVCTRVLVRYSFISFPFISVRISFWLSCFLVNIHSHSFFSWVDCLYS